MAEIDSLEIKISTNAATATQQMEKLKGSLEGVNTAVKKGNGNVNESTKKLSALQRITVALSGNSALGGIKKTVSGLGKVFNKITTPLTRFLQSFGRMVRMRFFRALVRSIVDAFKEGTSNAYQWSKAINGDFASSMDSLATSFLYLKNSIGAMATSIINTFGPAIEAIVDKVANAFNAASEIMASLSGSSTWVKAIKYQTEYAEATDATTAAVKRSVLGFDELNKLTDNSSDSTQTYTKMFETVEMDQTTSAISSAFGDAKGMAAALAETINNAIANIDVQQIGVKLGKKIQAALDFVSSFIKNLNFGSMGNVIGSWLNNVLENFDLTDFLLSLTDLVIGIIEFTAKLIGAIDWGVLGTSIFKAIEGVITGLDWNGLVSSIFELLGAAISATVSLTISLAQGLISTISDALSAAVEYFKERINKAGGDIVLGIMDGIVDALIAIETWIKTNIVDPLISGIKKAFGIGSSSSQVSATGKSIVTELVNGFKEGWPSVTTFISNKLADLKTIFASAWNAIKTTASTAFSGLATIISNALGKINLSSITSKLKSALGSFSNLFDTDFFANLFVKGYATGGTPATGELFIANESGPELVGQVNGRTTVTNQDQFTEGLANANEGVIDALVSGFNSVITAINNKPSATISKNDIRQAYRQMQNQYGV